MVFPLGLHVGIDGYSAAQYLNSLNAMHMSAFVKVVNDTGRANEVLSIGAGYGVVNTVLYRSTVGGDVPDYNLDPEIAAAQHYKRHAPHFSACDAKVWIETINEPDKNRWEWLGWFCAYTAEKFLSLGLRWCGPACNSGEPESVDDWTTDGWRAFFTLASQHPESIAVSVHQYNFGNDPWDQVFPWHVGREQQIRTACTLMDLPVPKIFVSEWGFGYDHVPPWNESEDFVRRSLEYYGQHDMAAALWCYQTQGEAPNIHHEAHALEPNLIQLAQTYDPPPPPPPPPPTSWQQDLWDYSIEKQTISLNPGAALQRAMFDRPGRWVPVGSEFWRTGPDAVQRAAQPAEDLATGERLVFYAVVPQFNNVQVLADPEHPPDPYELLAGVTLGPLFYVPHIITDRFNSPRTYGPHEGVDLDVTSIITNSTEPVRAAYPGVVYDVGYMAQGYGHHVTVEHVAPSGVLFRTQYAHMDSAYVSEGQEIGRGDPVGELGDTGGDWPEHVHLNLIVPGFGLSGYFVDDVIDPEPLLTLEVPSAGIDLLPYFISTSAYGPIYEVLFEGSGQTRHQTQLGTGGAFYHTKGNEHLAEWEQFFNDSSYIYRGVDTSPGNGQYYRLVDTGFTDRSRWIRRYMRVGDRFLRSPTVKYYRKSDCALLPGGGVAQTWIKFDAKLSSKTFFTGITLPDVIELSWLVDWATGPLERYWYARGYGLVAWSSSDGRRSAVSELHAPGTRPHNKREVIGCL